MKETRKVYSFPEDLAELTEDANGVVTMRLKDGQIYRVGGAPDEQVRITQLQNIGFSVVTSRTSKGIEVFEFLLSGIILVMKKEFLPQGSREIVRMRVEDSAIIDGEGRIIMILQGNKDVTPEEILRAAGYPPEVATLLLDLPDDRSLNDYGINPGEVRMVSVVSKVKKQSIKLR